MSIALLLDGLTRRILFLCVVHLSLRGPDGSLEFRILFLGFCFDFGTVISVNISLKGLSLKCSEGKELPDLSGLAHLEVLSLSYNDLSGRIPDLSKLKNLREVFF